MATTINGAFQAFPVEHISFARRFHRIRRQVIRTASDTFTAAKRGTTEHVIPAIAKGADVTLRAVDGACSKANKAAVDFLVKYPGIAMTLSPQTIVRMAVAARPCQSIWATGEKATIITERVARLVGLPTSFVDCTVTWRLSSWPS